MSKQLLQQAQELKKNGHIDDAVEIYRQLIAQAPQNVQPYRQLGDILFNQKKLEEAAQNYRKVIELAPNIPHAYFRLGQIHRAQKQWTEAVDNFQKAIALNPQNPWFHKEMGEIYLAQEQFDKANESLQKAIELKPNMPDAYLKLGITQQNQKQLAKAIASFEALLELNSNHLGAHHRLGDLYVQEKNLRKAIAHYQKAIENKHDNPFLHAKLARALRNDGQVEQSIGAWSAAILLKSDQHGFHEQLGDLLLQQEDREGAIASYEKAIALKPDLPQLQEKLNTALQEQTPIYQQQGATLDSSDLASTEAPLVEQEAVRTEKFSQVGYAPVNGTMDTPQLDELSNVSAIESDEQPDFDNNQLEEENIELVQSISTPEKESSTLSQDHSHEQFKEQHLSEEHTQTPLSPEKISETSEGKFATETNETSENIFVARHRTDADTNVDVQEMPIDVKLNQKVKQGKGAGSSGKVSFGKHRSRGARSIATDNTGFNKDFKFSEEGVGGYDESIPSPVKKIVLFLLLGFYGAIALTLFLRGLTVLGIFLVAIAAIIILIFWGFRKLK